MKQYIGLCAKKTFNSQAKKELRQELRKNAPKSELTLWKYLKNSQINNRKFRRQHGIGSYVVDFYCPELQLAIEVDGANHFFDDESTEYDLRRQKYIESFGIKVLRISNTDISENIDGVLDVIYRATI